MSLKTGERAAEIRKPVRKKKRWSRGGYRACAAGLSYVYLVYSVLLPADVRHHHCVQKLQNLPRKSFLYNLLHSDFVGFKNFKFFFNNKSFTMLLRNTLLYNIVFIILGIVIPVALALMINELYSKRKSKVYQTMMFFPHFLSWVVVSYFVYRLPESPD